MAKKATPMTTTALVSLAALVAATQSANGFLFAAPAAIQPLIDAGDAEINMEMVNPAAPTEFAARATPQGINKAMTEANTQAPATAPTDAAKPTFVRMVRTMTPKKRQSGGGVSLYPFDDLAAPVVGADGAKQCDAFFIAATAAKPKPEESLQSAVSAATRRYATKTGEKSITVKGKVVNGVQAPDTVKMRGIYAYTRKFSLVAGEYTPEGSTTPVKGAWIERVQ